MGRLKLVNVDGVAAGPALPPVALAPAAGPGVAVAAAVAVAGLRPVAAAVPAAAPTPACPIAACTACAAASSLPASCLHVAASAAAARYSSRFKHVLWDHKGVVCCLLLGLLAREAWTWLKASALSLCLPQDTATGCVSLPHCMYPLPSYTCCQASNSFCPQAEVPQPHMIVRLDDRHRLHASLGRLVHLAVRGQAASCWPPPTQC